jgi:predicted ATPase
MAKTIAIPKNDSNVDLTFESLVIVGANGSGKSRLGVRIEENQENTLRISAQRSLIFKDEIDVRSLSAAESYHRYGYYNSEPGWDEIQRINHAKNQKRSSRWGNRPEAHLLSDFDHVLSVVIAHEHAQSLQFKHDYKAGARPAEYPVSKLDRVLHVWREVMPHRDIEISDNKVYANNNTDEKFHGLGMSDGERVCFYLIAQAICAPENGLLIVDEPEIHLHRSIQNRLWDAIEAERSDCSFVYITHDLEFAASRPKSELIWVRDFDGSKWNWEKVDQIDGFPTELTLEILGSRKPVLFVEGTRDSIDTQIYRRIYPQFHVIPRESCLKVIESTRALRHSSGFHGAEAFGVIDRDYRADQVIQALEQDFIFVTPTAEAENAICLPCIVKASAAHLHKDPSEVMNAVIDVSLQFLQRHFAHQVKERASQEIRHAFSQFSSKGIKDKADFEQAADAFKSNVDAAVHYENAAHAYQDVLANRDYNKLLALLNNKGLEDAVAKTIGFADRLTMRNWVLKELDASTKSESVSRVGKQMLAELRMLFPTLPGQSELASSTNGEVANG